MAVSAAICTGFRQIPLACAETVAAAPGARELHGAQLWVELQRFGGTKIELDNHGFSLPFSDISIAGMESVIGFSGSNLPSTYPPNGVRPLLTAALATVASNLWGTIPSSDDPPTEDDIGYPSDGQWRPVQLSTAGTTSLLVQVPGTSDVDYWIFVFGQATLVAAAGDLHHAYNTTVQVQFQGGSYDNPFGTGVSWPGPARNGQNYYSHPMIAFMERVRGGDRLTFQTQVRSTSRPRNPKGRVYFHGDQNLAYFLVTKLP